MPTVQSYTYTITWSTPYNEYVARCVELPSISWLDADPANALLGIMSLTQSVILDLVLAEGKAVPASVGLGNTTLSSESSSYSSPSPTTMPIPGYCSIHQHHKWCQHNGGVMGPTGYEAPTAAPSTSFGATMTPAGPTATQEAGPTPTQEAGPASTQEAGPTATQEAGPTSTDLRTLLIRWLSLDTGGEDLRDVTHEAREYEALVDDTAAALGAPQSDDLAAHLSPRTEAPWTPQSSGRA